jgi:hypothetical protein
MSILIRDVQQATHSAGANTLTLPPFAVNPVNGDTILVAYATWSSINNQAAPTDPAGNPYTRVGTEVVHGVPEILGLWYAHNIVGGSSFAVTGRLIGNQYHTVIAWLIAGDYTFNNDFVHNGGPSAGTNPLSSGTSSPAPSGEAFFFGVMTYDVATAASDGSGWNTTGVNGFTATLQGRARLTPFSTIDCYTEYKIATAAAQAATWGISGSGHDYNALVASFSATLAPGAALQAAAGLSLGSTGATVTNAPAALQATARLVLGSPGATLTDVTAGARITQTPVEVFLGSPARTRTTQLALEVFTPVAVPTRTTQFALEVFAAQAAAARVTQHLVELWIVLPPCTSGVFPIDPVLAPSECETALPIDPE